MFGEAYLSENARLAVQGAVKNVKAAGHERVGTEDLLHSIFNNTKHDSRARYWLGKEAQTMDVIDIANDSRFVDTVNESKLKMLVVGSLAGMIEAAVMQPFLYWKTMVQINQPMVWTPAVAYRGMMVNTASIAPISGLQYAANGFLQKLYSEYNQGQPTSPMPRFLIAVGAGAWYVLGASLCASLCLCWFFLKFLMLLCGFKSKYRLSNSTSAAFKVIYGWMDVLQRTFMRASYDCGHAYGSLRLWRQTPSPPQHTHIHRHHNTTT